MAKKATSKSEMQVIRIERHDIHRRTSYLPYPFTKPEAWPKERTDLMQPVYKDGQLIGYEGTALSEIRWAQKNKHRYSGRMDIILINEKKDCTCHCGDNHRKNVQHAIYPGKGGTLVGPTHLLSPGDLEWAKLEAAKCWAVEELRPYCYG